MPSIPSVADVLPSKCCSNEEKERQSPRELISGIFSRVGKEGLRADARLTDYVSKMPQQLAIQTLQDCAQLDLKKARNPSAYLISVLQRRATEMQAGGGLGDTNCGSTVAATNMGYGGGRKRGGRVIREKRAKKLAASSAASFEPNKTKAAADSTLADQPSETAPRATEDAKASGSRQKARGGSESKRRRDEARASKRAEWLRQQGAGS